MGMRKLVLIISLFLSLGSQGQTPLNWLLKPASSSVSYDTDAVDYFTRVEAHGATINAGRKLAISNLFATAKTLGIYSSSSFTGGITVWNNASANAEQFKSATDVTWNGTLTHSSSGIVSNGSTGYGNTGLNASTFLTHQNCHISVYLGTDNNTANSTDIGGLVSNTSRLLLFARSSGNFITDNNNITSGTGRVLVANGAGSGYYMSSRTSSTDLKAYKNGSQIGSTATTTNTGTLPNNNIYLMCANNNGTPGFFSTRQLRFWSVGPGLNSTDAATWATAVNNVMTAFGLNIY